MLPLRSRCPLLVGLSIGLGVLLAGGACAPDRSAIPSAPPAFDAHRNSALAANPDSVRIYYLCENRFRVRNFNDLRIDVQWSVVGTSDSGIVSLPARQAGSSFSEAFLDVPDSGTVRLFMGGVRIASVQNRGGPCEVKRLTVRLEAGVVVTPLVLDTVYPIGATVAYSFAPAPGYTHVLVAMDDSLAPTSGSVVMSDDHVVWVAADVAVELPQAGDPLVTELRGLLAAADPVAAYQQILDDIGALSVAAGPDEASRRVRLAALVAVDPVRDSAALIRVDGALALHEFRVGSSDYDGSGGTGGPVIVANQLPTGPAHESAPGGGCAPQRPAEVPGSPEPTRAVFVNGIQNSAFDAARAVARIHCALDATGQTAGSRINTGFFYNRTWSVQRAQDIRANFWCVASTIRWAGYWSAFNQAVFYAVCAHQALGITVATNDYVEALTEYVRIHLNSPRIAEDADSLSRHLDHYRRGGAHVIMVAHSQGNMLVQQATKQLRSQGLFAPEHDSLCVGAVAISAPTSANWPVDKNLLAGVQVPGDIIGALQGKNRFPSITTPLSDSLAAELNALREQAARMDNHQDRRSMYAVIAEQEALNGLRLHSLSESYLGQQATRDAIVDDIIHIHRQCTVGRLVLAPATTTLRVQSSMTLDLSAINRNSSVMNLNRIPSWTVPVIMELSGNQRRITAKSPGSGEIIGRIFDREARADVDVPWESLVVSAKQDPRASWGLTLVTAPPDYPAPDPGPAPTWDGIPGHCTGSREFTVVEPVHHGTFRWVYGVHCWYSASASVQPPEGIRVARYWWRWFDTYGREMDSPTNRLTTYSPQDMPADDDLAPFAGWARLDVWGLNADGIPIAKGIACISNCGGTP